MSFSLIPRGVYPSFSALDPKELEKRGIQLVLADLDNTLASNRTPEPSQELKRWRNALEQRNIRLFILSNSRKPHRVERFARALEVAYQGHAGKPKRAGFLRALERMNCKPKQAVMIGDQIFTDTLGAHLSGITPLLILPVRFGVHPGRYLRFAVETPFRMLGRRRPFL